MQLISVAQPFPHLLALQLWDFEMTFLLLLDDLTLQSEHYTMKRIKPHQNAAQLNWPNLFNNSNEV